MRNETVTPGTEWNNHGRYEMAGGDRVALMEQAGRWAIMWSYAATDAPQLVEYGNDKTEALRIWRKSRQIARGKTPLVYDRPDCFGVGNDLCAPCQDA